jgi:hypothetical protein
MVQVVPFDVRTFPELPIADIPVPPSLAGNGVVRADKEVISEFAPEAATPKAARAEAVVVAPVPP